MTTAAMMKAYDMSSNTTVSVADKATFSVVTMNTTFNTTFDTNSSPSTIHNEDSSAVVKIILI